MSKPSSDPFQRVTHLGEHSLRVGAVLGVVAALSVHGGAYAKGATALFEMGDFAEGVQIFANLRLVDPPEIEIDTTPPPEPEKEEPEEEEPEEEEPTEEPVEAEAEQPTPSTPAAQAAQAGRVLAAEPDPDEPVDMTGWSMVQGEGDKYAGGTTATYGKSEKAVRSKHVAPDGVPGAKPKKKPKPKSRAKSKGRPASVTGTNWSSCGFPAEADMEQIDFARVRMVVTVGPGGRAKSVSILTNPGNGFAGLARRCAFRMKYRPAFDRDGKAISQSTPPFTVTFTR